ncbi:MAG: hypothetical protein ACD_46C00533G0007 [uncultured bacterium]|nr:MAG: hypothetical protein ACD_46C00533G0007 [uncultured bacterium]
MTRTQTINFRQSINYIIFAPLLIAFCYVIVLLEINAPYIYRIFLGGVYNPEHLSSLFFLIMYVFVGFFAIPYLTARYLIQLTHKNIGLCLPEINSSLCISLTILIGIFISFGIYFSKLPAFQAYYSFAHIKLPIFIFIQLFFLPIYYFAEEFFFRGFLFLTLYRFIGWHSYWIADAIFYVAHFNKPTIELLFSIPAGIGLNYLALKTKSIYPSMITHASMGFTLNCMMYF